MRDRHRFMRDHRRIEDGCRRRQMPAVHCLARDGVEQEGRGGMFAARQRRQQRIDVRRVMGAQRFLHDLCRIGSRSRLLRRQNRRGIAVEGGRQVDRLRQQPFMTAELGLSRIRRFGSSMRVVAVGQAGMFRRGFLFERNAFLTVYKNLDEELFGRLMPAVMLTATVST